MSLFRIFATEPLADLFLTDFEGDPECVDEEDAAETGDLPANRCQNPDIFESKWVYLYAAKK
jgi:hypothetical protein